MYNQIFDQWCSMPVVLYNNSLFAIIYMYSTSIYFERRCLSGQKNQLIKV